jgi:hypothetical protein
MSMAETLPSAALVKARRDLELARAKAVDDEPMLAEADVIIERLRSIRQENHWGPRVEAAFRQTRGDT